MKNIKFSTILIIAAIAGVIWYFTKSKKEDKETPEMVGGNTFSTYGPGGTNAQPLVIQPLVIQPIRPFIRPVVKPAPVVTANANVLANIRQMFFGRS